MEAPTISMPPLSDLSESLPLTLPELSEELTKVSEWARFHLSWDTSATRDEAAAWLDTQGATTLFLAAFAEMVMALSTPDHPIDADGTTALRGTGVEVEWDFDYYRWRLWVAERSDDHAVVLLERSSGTDG